MNNKLQTGPEPWAPFSGFSLLWDPPGDSPQGKLNLVPALDSFFGVLATWTKTISREACQDVGLHLLPPSSYHVTYWDGINQDNLENLPAEERGLAREELSRIPDLDTGWAPVYDVLKHLCTEKWPSCTLRLSGLAQWSGVSLVAVLSPCDQTAFEHIVARRQAWNATFGLRYGCWANETYVPHVTLGYYEDPEQAGLNPLWEHVALELLGAQRLDLNPPALYAFSDMASFYRLSTMP